MIGPPPYRYAPRPEPVSSDERADVEMVDGDLVPVFGLLWLASAVQVGAALHGRRCELIDVLAALALVMLPAMTWSSLGVLARRLLGCIRKV